MPGAFVLCIILWVRKPFPPKLLFFFQQITKNLLVRDKGLHRQRLSGLIQSQNKNTPGRGVTRGTSLFYRRKQFLCRACALMIEHRNKRKRFNIETAEKAFVTTLLNAKGRPGLRPVHLKYHLYSLQLPAKGTCRQDGVMMSLACRRIP